MLVTKNAKLTVQNQFLRKQLALRRLIEGNFLFLLAKSEVSARFYHLYSYFCIQSPVFLHLTIHFSPIFFHLLLLLLPLSLSLLLSEPGLLQVERLQSMLSTQSAPTI